MKNSVDFYRNNPLFLIAILYILGVIIGDTLVLPWTIYALFLGVFISIGVFGICRPTISSLSVHLATIIIGALIISIAKERVPHIDKGEHCYNAIVANQPQVVGKVYKCDLWLFDKGRPLKVKASLLRYTQTSDDTLRIGDGIFVSTSLQSVADINNKEGKFDYKKWLYINRYDATAFVFRPWMCKQVDISNLPSIEKLRIDASIYRNSLQEKYKKLGLEERSLALVSAMTIGDKSLLDRRLREDYSITGASHILALSGLHLAVLYAILNFITNAIAKFVMFLTAGEGRIIINFTKTLLLFGLIWGFAFMVGLTPSITRAAAMISIYALVDLTNRGHHPFNSLALTALILLIYNPFFLWDISFQLSFMAVLGIYFFQPKKKLNNILSLLWVSFSAQMAVTPLILYHFGRFSCFFLLTNIVVVPCANVILYSALFFLIFFPCVHIQQVAFFILSFFTNLMDGWVKWIAKLPWASIDNVDFNVLQTLALYVIIVCAYRIICLTLHSKI